MSLFPLDIDGNYLFENHRKWFAERQKEQESKRASITEEAEEAKQKPLEMKIDCSKAGSKYKYLQKRKAEADGKYVTAERELGDQREEKDKNV